MYHDEQYDCSVRLFTSKEDVKAYLQEWEQPYLDDYAGLNNELVVEDDGPDQNGMYRLILSDDQGTIAVAIVQEQEI